MANSEEMVNDVLMHHGIKGQKWGIRRTAAELGHKIVEAYKKKKKEKEPLSDDELRKRINSLNLEKQYRSLKQELHPTKYSGIKKMAREAMSKLTGKVIETGTSKIVEKMFKKKDFDPAKYKDTPIDQIPSDKLQKMVQYYKDVKDLNEARYGKSFDPSKFVGKSMSEISPSDMKELSAYAEQYSKVEQLMPKMEKVKMSDESVRANRAKSRHAIGQALKKKSGHGGNARVTDLGSGDDTTPSAESEDMKRKFLDSIWR